jgi:hypothetical protein
MHFRLIDDADILEKKDLSPMFQCTIICDGLEQIEAFKNLLFNGTRHLSDDLLMVLYNKADEKFQNETA